MTTEGHVRRMVSHHAKCAATVADHKGQAVSDLVHKAAPGTSQVVAQSRVGMAAAPRAGRAIERMFAGLPTPL